VLQQALLGHHRGVAQGEVGLDGRVADCHRSAYRWGLPCRARCRAGGVAPRAAARDRSGDGCPGREESTPRDAGRHAG
jgi:hypothetical protein